MTLRVEDRPLITAGVLLGIGLGGFVDGILFHQILQVHAMLTARIPNSSMENMVTNMFWDGLFHVATWAATTTGVWLLFRAARIPGVHWSGRMLLGSMIGGWGLFNLIEGLIDHHLLHLHHVIERLGLSLWGYAFLGSGVAFLLLAAWLVGTAALTNPARETEPHASPPHR